MFNAFARLYRAAPIVLQRSRSSSLTRPVASELAADWFRAFAAFHLVGAPMSRQARHPALDLKRHYQRVGREHQVEAPATLRAAMSNRPTANQ